MNGLSVVAFFKAASTALLRVRVGHLRPRCAYLSLLRMAPKFSRSRGEPKSPRPKGEPAKMDWEAWSDPNCVAEPGWREERADIWNCTTCKKYVKMYHIMKLWPRHEAQKYGPRREGPVKSCKSDHFAHRYHEVTIAVGIKNTRPELMLYSTMAMVWAEIVLHKDIDWTTVIGLNVHLLDRSNRFIQTNWMGPSDCYTTYSERSADMDAQLQQHGTPRAYGGTNHDTNHEDRHAPVSFGTRSEGYYHGNHQYGTPEGYMPPHQPDTYGVEREYGRGGSSSNYPSPMYTGGTHGLGGEQGSGSNVQGNSSSTHPMNPYNRENEYGTTFGSPEYRRPSHPKETYEYGGQYDRRSDIVGYTNYGYGQNAFESNNTPSAPLLSLEDEEARFQQDLQQATLLSQQEYIAQLENERNFRQTYLFGESSRGPRTFGAAPGRKHDDGDSDEE